MRRLLLIAPLIAAACTDPYEVCPQGDTRCIRAVQDANLNMALGSMAAASGAYNQAVGWETAYNQQLRTTVQQGGAVRHYGPYGQLQEVDYGY